MKNYLLCILIGLPTFLQAQALPTQIQRYDWNEALLDWRLRISDSYQYDERDSVRVTDSQTNWFGPSREIIFKDENGKVIESLSLWLDENDEWINSSRSTITVEEGGLEIHFTERWDEDHWEPHFLNNIRTNELADGIETDRETQVFANGVWTKTIRNFSKKNATGLELIQRQYRWKNNAWLEAYQWENLLNDQGDVIFFEYVSKVNGDRSRRRWAYTYNAAGQPLTIKQENSSVEPAIWILHSDQTFVYDQEGRITSRDQLYNAQNRSRREETAYRGDTIIFSIYHSPINGPLFGLSRRWKIPNPKTVGPDLYSRYDAWENNQWVPSTIIRRKLTYDQYDNLVRMDQENFENGEWEPRFYISNNWEYREDGEPLKTVRSEYNYTSQRQTPYGKTIWRYEDRKKNSDRPMIALSPNPSTGPLTVNFHSAPVLPIRWELIDEAGRLVRAADIGETEQKIGIELYFEELQFGLYILQIQYEDGSTVAKKWQKI